ncbi:MAG: MepB family protein [Chitinophagaceae bacterium]
MEYSFFQKQFCINTKFLSSNDQKGKLGTRVYPTWELANNNQALKTQAWQTTYFIDLSNA